MNYLSPLVTAGAFVLEPPFFKVDPTKGSIVEDTVTFQRWSVLTRYRINPAPRPLYFRAILTPEV